MSDWQPIETYDKLTRKPKLAVFRFASVANSRNEMDEVYQLRRTYGFRTCTHWMPFIPATPETTDG